jgi:cyclase
MASLSEKLLCSDGVGRQDAATLGNRQAQISLQQARGNPRTLINHRQARARMGATTHQVKTLCVLEAVAWARQAESLGAGEILLTSMDRDGTRAGYDLDLLRAVTRAVRIPVIASGGVGNVAHLVEGARAGATGLLAASIFHFGEISIATAKAALAQAGVPVRQAMQAAA